MRAGGDRALGRLVRLAACACGPPGRLRSAAVSSAAAARSRTRPPPARPRRPPPGRAPPREHRRARRCAPPWSAPRPRRAARGPRRTAGSRRPRRRRREPGRGAALGGRGLVARAAPRPPPATSRAKRTSRQRERTVSSSASGSALTQDQVGESRRLLERLQQRVLALLGHRLGRLDHEHPPLALERPVGDCADHPLAHVLDQVLGPGRAQPDEVGMRRGIGERPPAGVVGVGGAVGEELGGERARGRAPCPSPRGPGEQVGVGRGRRAPPSAPRAPRAGRPVRLGDRQLPRPRPAHRTRLTAAITRAWTSSTRRRRPPPRSARWRAASSS